ncbi:MAG: NAD(P)H-hydrate dehydratase [Eubacteriales bacterium]|nr:NAD(P)H-hydrate dehydratase [Eubacteriales bacterium]
MYFSVSPKGMKALEQTAIDKGISAEILMENAAKACQEFLKDYYIKHISNPKILLVCGTGNNGGDGLALARLLSKENIDSYVYLTGEPKTPESQKNLERLKETDVKILEDFSSIDGIFDLVVDAVFGTGFHGEPKGNAAEAIEKINNIGVPVVSIDIPSGVDGFTGKTEGLFVRATNTISIGVPKHGIYLNSDGAAGEITRVDIGLENPIVNATGGNIDFVPVMQAGDLKMHLPYRKPYGHKGDFGKVLLYAGSFGMAGAAIVAAQAAVKSGAGITYIMCDKKTARILQVAVPNAICTKKAPQDIDVLALGCGIKENKKSQLTIFDLFNKDIPSIWDAGALNLLAKNPAKLGKNAIITPHIGEAARLLNKSRKEISDNMFAAVKELHDKYGCNVMLKGVSTVMYDGHNYALQPGRIPALAKGGSGDALVGILAAICAQQEVFAPMVAMQTAIMWLNAAGRYETKIQGEYSPTSLDVVNSLGKALVARNNWL